MLDLAGLHELWGSYHPATPFPIPLSQTNLPKLHWTVIEDNCFFLFL